jgi:DNA-binding transcriptional LysR family regulator
MYSNLFPPIAAIRALEAAVRLQSFSAAAAELNVSQSAISQAVRRLEEQLAVRMFTREPGRVVATDAGRNYATVAGTALDALKNAARMLQNPLPRKIVLGCSRALLNHWLLPRIARTESSLGQLDVRGLEREPKELAAFDVIILYGGPTPPIKGAQMLSKDVLIAVGAPAVVQMISGTLEDTKSIDQVHLLGGSWDLWSLNAKRLIPHSGGIRIRETSALVSATRNGDGVALLPRLVCADDVKNGKLVIISDVTVDRGRGYWLYRRNTDDALNPVAEWLIETFYSAV